MKRLMHILISTLLSVMIIVMGSGVIVVHCNHTGTTRVVTYNQTCEKQCKTTSSCMKTYILKFSTMGQVQHQTLEHTLPVVILPWLMQPLYELIDFTLTTSDTVHYASLLRHGPPREYLNFICVLLI